MCMHFTLLHIVGTAYQYVFVLCSLPFAVVPGHLKCRHRFSRGSVTPPLFYTLLQYHLPTDPQVQRRSVQLH